VIVAPMLVASALGSFAAMIVMVSGGDLISALGAYVGIGFIWLYAILLREVFTDE